MLGFAPLAANPLASAGSALTSVLTGIAATGGITFGGSPSMDSALYVEITSTGGISFAGAPAISSGRPLNATGGIRFAGSPVWTALAYKSSTGGITFNGSPFLSVAGKPLIIAAVPQSFTVRADMVTFTAKAQPDNLTFRGVK